MRIEECEVTQSSVNVRIEKCEVTYDSVSVTLANGVKVCLSSNQGYIHLHFSGISPDGVVATPFANHPEFDGMRLANYIDVQYQPANKM